LQELNTTRDAVLAAAPNAEIKVRWLSPMRVTVSLVDWQKTDAAVKALPVFSAIAVLGGSLCVTESALMERDIERGATRIWVEKFQ